MGSSIFQFLHKFFYIIFFGLVLFLVGLNVYMSRGYSTLSLETPSYFNVITLGTAVLLAGAIFYFRRRLIELLGKVPVLYGVSCLLGISLILQMITIKELNVHPTWDFGEIIKSAKLFVEKGEIGDYFTMYPNNILLVCILAVIGKISTPALLVFQLFNVMVITISQFLIYRIASKLAGRTVGMASLLVSVFFFPYFFYAPIVYTDTISLIFLLLPLEFMLSRNGELKHNPLLLIAASTIFSLGMLLKGSLIIFTIAFAIILFLYMSRWKKLYAIIPFIVLFLVKSLFTAGIYQWGLLDAEKVEQRSMPVTHWMVMGQNEDRLGKYAQTDVDWTTSLLKNHSREEVTEAHLQELKKRLAEKGIVGNLAFNIEKIGHTWTDGTYYSLNKLRRYPVHPENFQRLTDYKSGHLLQAYARVQHLLLFFGLLLALRLKGNHPFTSFAMLSIIGFFLFFILWETRSRYLVSLTPLLIILSCMGYLGRREREA
ncbi:glycosyltransferase family 39 protein [Rossellomorea vietnamensis]|uniref:glycosyltransferase family 39 protein n=1 Tax=Rossellomorea vietnamensis TaxID=218284 RepID=UPI001CCDE080|nr:glycosyltransferase family 39 protein [Rossellomorea vietnamensis]MCA0150438.1 glycosyltransferase family 39 protein [Rossellomorea vietnamensis]